MSNNNYCKNETKKKRNQDFQKNSKRLRFVDMKIGDIAENRGGFRGGGAGGRTPPPSGIRPPADPKGPPFDTFSEIHFWPTDPKIFLKAPSAPIYTNFEGERAPKKRDFFVKIFQKLPKNGFFDCFIKNLPAALKILPK